MSEYKGERSVDGQNTFSLGTVDAPEPLIRAVERVADARGVSRVTAVRQLLHAALADQGKPRITAPCARCGVNLVVTTDTLNSNLDVCGGCGVQIGRDELGVQITDEMVERGARAVAQLEPGEDWPSNEDLGANLTGTRDDEYRSACEDTARAVLEAALGGEA